MSERVERLRELLSRASPAPWLQEPGFNNAGCPTAFFKIPQHNMGADVEMLADDAEFICALRNAAPALLKCVEVLSRQLAHWDEHCGCERKPAHEQDECQGDIEKQMRAALRELELEGESNG